MVSALVPVYNTDVAKYIEQIIQQFITNRINGEIICIDDASSLFKDKNKLLANLEFVKYIELEKNIGRSAIRNKLADLAVNQWLFFSDGDSLIDDNDFLHRYLNNIAGDHTVLYGGTAYGPKPSGDFMLHWKYGCERECINALKRNQNPYGTFKTNNFFLHKTTFDTCRFNENVSGYGHEDTLFAKDLQNNGFKILHIENPLLHNGLETTDEFITKQIHAIENLVYMYKKGLVGNEIRLIAFYHKLKKLGLLKVVLMSFAKKEKLIQNLKHSNPSIRDLDKLKLLLFHQLINA